VLSGPDREQRPFRALTMIDATELVCRFGPLRALDGASIQVPRGGFTVLVGPNGAGKTTLIRVLATLRRPDGGDAFVGGHEVVSGADSVRRLIGYVGHRTMLYPDLTVQENLSFHARLHGVANDDDVLRSVLVQVGLDQRRHDRVRGLSRGMLQRLAIARATLHDPPVLLLDEPHTGLDPTAAEALDETLTMLVGQGRTVLLATHDLARASRLADRIVMLHRGRVVWEADAGDLSAADLEARYRASVEGAVGAEEVGGPARGERADEREQVSARGRTGFMAATRALVWKDFASELRARAVVPPVLVFSLLIVVIFQFALPPDAAARQAAAAGGLWVALLLGSTLGLSRTMATDSETDGITGILVSPIDRGAIFAGKWTAAYLFALLVAVMLLPFLVVLLELRITPMQVLETGVVLALGLAGWTAAGVLFGAMAVSTRAREVLLPVLLYPMVLPLVIPAVQATGLVFDGSGLAAAAGPLGLIVAFDAVFWVLGFLFLSHIAGE